MALIIGDMHGHEGSSEEGGCKLVKGIKQLVDEGIDHVPDVYMRPLHERPRLSEVSHCHQIPLIDLFGDDHVLVSQIGRACQEWGVFQVVNHGVPERLIEGMWKASRLFFEQPAEERMRYFCVNSKERLERLVKYVTSFNHSQEAFLNWKDSLRFRFTHDNHTAFDHLPSISMSRILIKEYCMEVLNLGRRLYDILSKSLQPPSTNNCENLLESHTGGVDANIHVSIHYYPPCPDPNITLGIGNHNDPNVITILLQDNVGGLQVCKDGRWIAINPIPNSFIVNVGDQLEILTNGRYKSVEHRVITNSKMPRMSVPMFFNPSEEKYIEPLPHLIDESNPPLYKSTMYKDYIDNFYNNGLSKGSTIDFATIDKPLEDQHLSKQ